MTTLEESGYQLSLINGLTQAYHPINNQKLNIIRRYPFTSTLKRMSIITHNITNNKYYVFVKGAPEIIENMLLIIPSYYITLYNYHMSRGKRVLSLCYKEFIIDSKTKASNNIDRNIIESKLIFLGFLIFDSNLKADSKSVIKELKDSNHQVVMITGKFFFKRLVYVFNLLYCID